MTPTPTPTPKQDALELVFLRNQFYRDQYRRMTSFAVVMLTIVASLAGFMYYMYIHRSAPQYFATTATGALIPIIPLSQPNMSTNQLLEWAANAAVSAYGFNFVNYKEALQAQRIHFTAAGYQNFLKALKDANVLDSVLSEKYVVWAIPTSTPAIDNEALAGDSYAWRVRMPMSVSFRSDTKMIRQDVNVNMLVNRISTLDSPDGVAISQFIVEQGRTVGK